MTSHTNAVPAAQANLSLDVVPSEDVVTEAESMQNAWGKICALATSSKSPSIVPETPISPTDNLSIPTDANQAEATNLDDEEFGELAASTDPLKRPIYDATEEYDEIPELLHSKSAPEWEADTFVGVGIVKPVRARFDTTTRGLLRASKLARWKRNDSRANMISTGHKKKQPQGIGVAGVSDAPAATPIEADSYNEYLEVPRAPTPTMNGVIRPVSFGSPVI